MLSPREVRLPLTDRKGIETYYGHRGYRKNPVLQWREGASMTFVKPLPDGRRIHDRVYERDRYFRIERHIDHHDPGRSPVRHILVDMQVKRRNRVSRVPKQQTAFSLLKRLRRLSKRFR